MLVGSDSDSLSAAEMANRGVLVLRHTETNFVISHRRQPGAGYTHWTQEQDPQLGRDQSVCWRTCGLVLRCEKRPTTCKGSVATAFTEVERIFGAVVAVPGAMNRTT